MKKLLSKFESDLNDNISTHLTLLESVNEIEKIIYALNKCLSRGGKIMFCGNGGSAADAQHLAAEFLVRLRPNINRKPYPVISLAQDTSTLTACGNDLGFEKIFERNLEALATKKDLLIYCYRVAGTVGLMMAKVLQVKDKQALLGCLLYTSDAADEEDSVDLDGRRIIKTKNTIDYHRHTS